MFINSADENKREFSTLKLTQANKARVLQMRIGKPNTHDYIHYVSTNMILNYPVTIQDTKNVEFIWGPDLGCVKGKTVRQVSPTMRMENNSIPVSIMQQYKNVTLSVDIMKVEGIPFLMTISRDIKFGSASKLDNIKKWSHTQAFQSFNWCVRHSRF